MQEQEKIIKQIYGKYKTDKLEEPLKHIEEEGLVCFAQGKLSKQESLQIKEHLINCKTCADKVSIFLNLNDSAIINAQEKVIEGLEGLVLAAKKNVLEIFIKAKNDLLELISTNGNILIGQELVSEPLLRSRKINDLKNEIEVLEDFDNSRVQVKISNKGSQNFNLNIVTSKRNEPGFEKNLRFTLLKDGIEIESYVSDSGEAFFDQLLTGKYEIQLSNSKTKLASIILDLSA